MSVSVFLGYKDEYSKFQGIIGDFDISEYELLTNLSKKCLSRKAMSLEELQSISDDRHDLANLIIKRYFKKNESSGDEKLRIETEIEKLYKIFKKYDEFRDYVPQLDLLLSLSIITLDHKFTRELELDKDIESLDEVFLVLNSDSQDKIPRDKLKNINMTQELYDAYHEFFSIQNGFNLLDEAGTSEDDKEALESEIA